MFRRAIRAAEARAVRRALESRRGSDRPRWPVRWRPFVLNVDVDDDAGRAVVQFIGRNPDVPYPRVLWKRTAQFRREDGTWKPHGVGDSILMQPVRAVLRERADVPDGQLLTRGGTSFAAVVLGPHPTPPSIDITRLLAGPGVARIQVGSRTIDIPKHGHAVAVWESTTRPDIRCLGADGTELSVLNLNPVVEALKLADSILNEP